MKRQIGAILLILLIGAGFLWAARLVGDRDVRLEWFRQNEYQLRRILNVPPKLGLAFRARSKSQFEGYDKLTLELIRGEERQTFDLIVSDDGRRLYYDRIYLLADPFSEIRNRIDLDRSPFLGSASAPVTVVKYSDYTCFYCRRFYTQLQEKLLARYGDRIRFVHKLFPAIGYREHAQQSAVAAACAFRQGNRQFWAMHGELFTHVEQFGEGARAFEAMARRAGLNLPSFRKCFQQQESLVDIARDQQEGLDLRVDGTPTFFVNGRPVAGMPTEEFFYRIIDEELAEAQKP